MPIYGKKPFKNLLLQNRRTDFHETWYVALGTPAHHSLFKWWPFVDLDLFYGKVKICNLGFSIGKVKTVDFSDTIAASDLKVGRSRHLIEFVKLSVLVSIEGQCHFLTLAQIRVHTKIRTTFSQKLLCHSEPNFVWKLSGTRKWKFVNKMLVTWPRWPPCPYMVKNLQISSPEPAGRFPRSLVSSIGDASPS